MAEGADQGPGQGPRRHGGLSPADPGADGGAPGFLPACGHLAPAVGADLDVMARDAKKMRGPVPVVFAQVKHGGGVDDIIAHVLHAWQHASGVAHHH